MTRQLTAVTAVSATLIVGVWATGCGSSGGGTPSRVEFLRQGNAICAQTVERLRAAAQAPAGKRPSPKQAKSTAIAAIQGEIDALRLLGSPPGEQARVTAMLDAGQRGLNEAKGDPELLVKISNPFAAFRRMAFRYGLPACALVSVQWMPAA